MAESGRRPRIAVISDFLPSGEQPYRGLPLYSTVQALRMHAEVDAYCVDPIYPAIPALHPRHFQYVAPDPTLAARPDVRSVRYPAFPLLSRRWNGYSCARRLLPLLERSRPDLIIGYFAYPPGEAAVRLGRSLGIPAVVGVLGSDVRIVRGSTRRAVSKALRKAAYVLGVSRDLCQHAVGLGADPERVIAIPNGCDGEIFRPGNRLQARHELGVSQESELIVYVGRLVALKGLRELFQAMAQLSQSNPSTELACIGDGPLAEELAACADRELRGRVRMLGSQAPKVIAKWLAAANLLCLPSHSEGCPNVVLEALSAGRPVVASEVGGVPDLLDAESGLLVKPRDPTSLSRAIELALRRAWDEDAIAAKSRRTWQDVAAETFGVCQRALASASSQAAPLGMLADKNNLWAKTS